MIDCGLLAPIKSMRPVRNCRCIGVRRATVYALRYRLMRVVRKNPSSLRCRWPRSLPGKEAAQRRIEPLRSASTSVARPFVRPCRHHALQRPAWQCLAQSSLPSPSVILLAVSPSTLLYQAGPSYWSPHQARKDYGEDFKKNTLAPSRFIQFLRQVHF